jgi:hypothetical protein
MNRRIVIAAALAALLLPACLASAGEVEDLERRIRETEERIAREKKKAEEASARAKEFDAKARDARHAAAEKGGEAGAQGRRADGEKRRVDANVRAAQNAKNAIADLEKKVAERKKGVQNLQDIRARNVNDEQVDKLRRASKAQDDIAARIALLREILENDEPDPVKLASENRTENPLVTRNTASMALADAYEMAKELEDAITESYKDIKATQTAIDRRMDFEAAQQITDVAKAVRLEADRAVLEDTPRTKEALDAQKVAQTEVVREADNIVETAVAMMQEALEIVQPDQNAEKMVQNTSPKTIEWMSEEFFENRDREEARKERLEEMAAAADFQVAITEAAAENEEVRAKDLAKLMEEAAEAESAKDAASAEAVDAAETEAPENPATAASAASSTASGTIPPPDPSRPGLVGGNVIRFQPDAPGEPAKWMYVRDWYSIGPFPNPDRINIQRKFPPESVVDLDATYVGKDGRTIKWEFMQTRNAPPKESWMTDGRASATAPNAEEYGIWYAYAEVFTDVACDRWIAVGSDDRSDVWVNDMPVWGSSNKLKSWRIDEGYRRIHLEKGRNRILARIENGWYGMSWSLCISLEDGELAL